MTLRLAPAAMVAVMLAWPAPTLAEGLVPPIKDRFSAEGVEEVPDFQRHVLPLMSRLGCNGRACHGSFQGRGGFRLSLFGYDFKSDLDALMAKDSGRVDVEGPEVSKILLKPTLVIPHEGGKRLEEGSWAYNVFVRWMEAGAKGHDPEKAPSFERLEVTPTEIVFDQEGGKAPLKVLAHWSDGTIEDVTCVTRFRTNDEAVAEVSEEGVVSSKGKGDTHIVAFYDNGVAVTPVLAPVSEKVGPNYPEVPTPTRVDALVVEKLRKLGIVPSDLAGDSEFLRRVRIDLTGTLPTPAEIQEFLSDSSPEKRATKVEALLNSPEYAAWWASKLCDLTGDTPRAFQGNQLNNEMAKNWYSWLERRLRENTPFDQLVAGIVLGTSRRPGQSYDDFLKEETTYYRDKDPADFTDRETMPYFWARRNLRTPDEKALGFSYAFLGVRLECAQCHKHPFDLWTQDDFKKFTAFFSPIGYGVAPDARGRQAEMRKELGLTDKMGGVLQRELARLTREGTPVPMQEVFINDGAKGAKVKGQKRAPNNVTAPKILGGGEVDLASFDDPRQPLMDWLRSANNPYFARSLVNRVWAAYFGRGIIHPTDDLNLANPPSNAPLLDHLAEGFVASGYDLRWLHREITGSATYQRSWTPNETNRLDEKNFSRALVRRLPAEVVIDAVAQVSGGAEALAKVGTPEGLADRAIGPKGGASLARNGNGDYASRVFGRSARDTPCDCSASTDPNLLQSIFLQNDQELLTALDRRGGWLDEVVGASTRSSDKTRAEEEKLVAQFQERVETLRKETREARAAGKTAQFKDLRLQLQKRREDLALHQNRLAKLPESGGARAFDADGAVDEAFLRALGRHPSPAELERSRAHLRDSKDPSQGFRGLLWALLNTKEFVTNH